MALTNQDLKYIRHEIDAACKELESNLKTEISHLPTKDEFFERMDFLAGELKYIRQELPVINHQLARHEKDIETIKATLNLSI